MITQLNPPLPLATSRGPGLAHFLIDYGPEQHLMWVVFLDANGQCWTVPNPEIRIQENWSLNRRFIASDQPIPQEAPAPAPDLPEPPPPPVELPPPSQPPSPPPLKMERMSRHIGLVAHRGASVPAALPT